SAHKPSEILILSGATASGKSALAMELAATRPCVIINADAMQMYRPLRIITVRPTPAEEAATPHALYGVLEAEESSSVARWLSLVVPTIRRVWAEGKLPLLTGGTGMYLKALMEGLAEVPEIPAEIRQRVRESRVERRESSKIHGSSDDPIIGSSSLHALLTEKDPIMAARLKPGDTQRILRALEVIEATGRSLDYFQRQPAALPLPEARFHLFMTELPRAEIYRRIDARFLKMVEEGAVEEVRKLVAGGRWQVANRVPPLTSPPQAGGIREGAQAGGISEGAQAVMDNHLPPATCHSPLFKAHGVPELIAHLSADMTLEAAIAQAQQNTRHYAKRQGTWLRNQFPEARRVASAKEIFASIDGSS
ncbi:MAG: tRNA (adenosine(37)-N6)-dimethylallyltransferase MiaA, partial [Alphaproteobacteria bacterium]